MKNTVKIDIAIVGGGIAGLWLLNRLRALGYSVILLESESLGAGQTSKSQGIIHGGIKYALQGMMTNATQSIVDMPVIWQQCLAGTGEIDLSEVQILSQKQYLWSPNTLGGKISGFFANISLNSQVRQLKKQDYPELMQHPDFKGQVYLLNEVVIDSNSLIRKLIKPHQDAIFKISHLKLQDLHFNESGHLNEVQIYAEPLDPISITAEKFIFTAGAGNEFFLQAFKNKDIAMQRRPLHMVMMKTQFPYSLYAHCLGMSSVPRITITTHQSHDGQTVWYLGGQLAEEGVTRDQATQIQVAKKELQELFPWIDLSTAQFASFFIDRAEGLQADGKRPDSCVVKEIGNVIIAWPTKLALTPKLSEEVIACIKKSGVECHTGDIRALRGWPMPIVAKPIWDELL